MRVGRRLTYYLIPVALAALALGHRTAHAQRSLTTIAAGRDSSELRAWDQRLDRMSRDGELRMRRRDQDTLMPGRSHERLDQFYKGVKVFGGDVTRQLDRGGSTISAFGSIYEGIDLDVTPTLSTDDALAIVEQRSGVSLGPGKVPQLLVLPDQDGYRLVYTLKAFRPDGGTEYVIDAQTGAVIRELDAMQRQSAVGTGTGVLSDTKKISATAAAGAFFTDDLLRPPLLRTYDMRGDTTRTINFLNGFSLADADRGTDTDNAWTDGAVVDAHAYAGYVYDYYYRRFGRQGLDNNNIRIQNVVHPILRSSCTQANSLFGSICINAAYVGDGIMIYGEGSSSAFNGQQWNYLSGALDVVGHELSHGVTAYTSNLIYQGESGALNESFSDMMGTAIEFFYQPAGSGPLQADYLCGEDVVVPGGIRSLSNPAAFGQPDHYSKRVITANDNGGVHTNSGIGNQFYFLAIEGGTNRTSGLTVTGVGQAKREQIEKVVYRGFTQMLPSNATYATARAATIQAARDLYGAGSPAETAVTQAWTAVGVN